MNDRMTNREAEICLMAVANRGPMSEIREMFEQVDKDYGNTLSEKEKFKYVTEILKKEQYKRLTYDDLNPVFFEKAKSRGVAQVRADRLDEETIRTFGSFLTNLKEDGELFQFMEEVIK